MPHIRRTVEGSLLDLTTGQFKSEEKFYSLAIQCYEAIAFSVKDKKEKIKALQELKEVLSKYEKQYVNITNKLNKTIDTKIKKLEGSFWQKLKNGFGKVWEFTKSVFSLAKWAAVIGSVTYGLAYFGVFGKAGREYAKSFKNFSFDSISQFRELFMDKERAKLRKQQRALLKIYDAYKQIQKIPNDSSLSKSTKDALIQQQNIIITEQKKFFSELGGDSSSIKDQDSTFQVLKGVHKEMDEKGLSGDKDEPSGWIIEMIEDFWDRFSKLSCEEQATYAIAGLLSVTIVGGVAYWKVKTRNIRQLNKNFHEIKKECSALRNQIKPLAKELTGLEHRYSKELPPETTTKEPKKQKPKAAKKQSSKKKGSTSTGKKSSPPATPKAAAPTTARTPQVKMFSMKQEIRNHLQTKGMTSQEITKIEARIEANLSQAKTPQEKIKILERFKLELPRLQANQIKAYANKPLPYKPKYQKSIGSRAARKRITKGKYTKGPKRK